MKQFARTAIIALVLMAPNVAAAQENSDDNAQYHSETAIQETGADTTVSGDVFGLAAVADDQLKEIAGREDTSQVSQAELNAQVTRNSVGNNSTTGAAEISGNAFQNMSGLSILNVNTGNNVAINAAMNVNLSISPAP